MGERAANIGIDDIMEAWEGMHGDHPCFSLWFNGREKTMQFTGDSLETARTSLEANLLAMGKSNDYALYYLRVHPKQEIAYKPGSDYICSLPCRLHPIPGGMGAITGYNNNNEVMSKLNDITSLFKSKFDEIDERLAEIEETEPPKDDIMSQINGVLSHPTLQPLISGLIGQFIPGIAGINKPQPPAAINGVPDEPPAGEDQNEKPQQFWDNVDIAIDRLMKVEGFEADRDLKLLADLAETQPLMFNGLLAELRKLQS